ncbi:transcriptional repressor CTCF-like [Dermacentor silvarum]|uniref:transcriptional repressor CTCF-like n=1 Tax=Dermacentor silvarum TaxID=543639 RepID=UPI0018991F9E|nr:transcriptional repressor CTCF-like [Dermacentor silvarum]
MNIRASLSVVFFVAILNAPAFSQDEDVKKPSRRRGSEDRGGGSRETKEGADYEPKDFEGVFTRSMKKVQRQVRRRHNHYRRLHGVDPLEGDDELDRYAQAWALHLAKLGKVVHRRKKTYGENLYEGTFDDDNPIRGKDAVDAWYRQIDNYDFTKNCRQRRTSKFTQIIWKDTSALGTGIARGKDGTYYLVSVYDPRGNVRGEYRDNVLKPIEGEGETRPRPLPKPGPEPKPEPKPKPVLTPEPEPEPKPEPEPEPNPVPQKPPKVVTNQAGQPLIRLNGCPGKKALTFKINVSPNT